MSTRVIDRTQMKLLLEHQQDELDTAVLYEYLAGLCSGDEARTFEGLAEDERRHAEIFRSITGERLDPYDGKRRRAALLKGILSRNKFYKRLADAEQESAVRYEKLLGDFPELSEIKQDELRHFDTLLAMMD